MVLRSVYDVPNPTNPNGQNRQKPFDLSAVRTAGVRTNSYSPSWQIGSWSCLMSRTLILKKSRNATNPFKIGEFGAIQACRHMPEFRTSEDI